MKYLILSSVTMLSCGAAADSVDYSAVSAVKRQIGAHGSYTAQRNASYLAYEIVRVSKKYRLDPLLLSALVATESNYEVGAVNDRTKDYGILQVSARNIKHYKLNMKRMITDVPYSLDAGARVLAWFQKTYAKREPRNWFCRYNVGTRALKGNLMRLCVKYAEKVWRKL